MVVLPLVCDRGSSSFAGVHRRPQYLDVLTWQHAVRAVNSTVSFWGSFWGFGSFAGVHRRSQYSAVLAWQLAVWADHPTLSGGWLASQAVTVGHGACSWWQLSLSAPAVPAVLAVSHAFSGAHSWPQYCEGSAVLAKLTAVPPQMHSLPTFSGYERIFGLIIFHRRRPQSATSIQKLQQRVCVCVCSSGIAAAVTPQ